MSSNYISISNCSTQNGLLFCPITWSQQNQMSTCQTLSGGWCFSVFSCFVLGVIIASLCDVSFGLAQDACNVFVLFLSIGWCWLFVCHQWYITEKSAWHLDIDQDNQKYCHCMVPGNNRRYHHQQPQNSHIIKKGTTISSASATQILPDTPCMVYVICPYICQQFPL